MTASERTWCGYPEAHSAAYYERLRLSRYARQAERVMAKPLARAFALRVEPLRVSPVPASIAFAGEN